ncbi:hypothetical protein DFS34DRAFT_650417 [Phlyctochytrium arcticum]|nr:hypothetical protein DFS34DRAFT_650417 [Phlyctochytrium arcticum]
MKARRSRSTVLALGCCLAALSSSVQAQVAGDAFEILSDNSGVVAVHLALLPNDKALMTERFHEVPSDWRRLNQDGTPNAFWNKDVDTANWADSSPFYQPNKNLGDFFTDAAEFDLSKKSFTMLRYAYDLAQGYSFCNGAAQMADGGILIAGGDQKWNMQYKGVNYTTDGRRDVRKYLNGALTKVAEMPLDTRTVKTEGDLSGRWYPTVVALPDEKHMILGGHKVYWKPLIPEVNNPTYEIYPGTAGKNLSTPATVQLLANTFPVNMYPIAYVLPSSGDVWMLAGNKTGTVSAPGTATSTETAGASLPEDGVYPRSFPFAGTNWMDPLTRANNYKPTVWVCGGTSRSATPDGYENLAANATRNWFDNCSNCAATAKCYHIDPETKDATFVAEDMPLPRSQPMAINLPDGTIAILGGSAVGHQGGDAGVGYLAHNPVNKVTIFDPSKPVGDAKRWQVGAEATVPRLYHGTSVLRTDGSVILSGSDEQNFGPAERRRTDPYELRVESYKPWYFTAKDRLSLDLANTPATLHYNQLFVLPLTTPSGAKISNATFIRYGTSTHTLNIDQRSVELEIVKYGASKLLVRSPANANIAPPGNYMLFAVDNRRVPVVQAATINLRASNQGTDAVWIETDTIQPEATPTPSSELPKDTSSDAGHSTSSTAAILLASVFGGALALCL